MAPSAVLIVSLIFAFWFLPIQYINPACVDWVFTRLPHLTDASGHAIQAMFYAREAWHWPPGKLVGFGGPFGASLIMGAVSPVFAFPAKLLESAGLIGPFWQFIGIQGVIGICLTAVAVYFLARALGASEIASTTAAILCLPLPGLFVLAIFNESLSWQFLAIIPMILLLNDKEPAQPAWTWFALTALVVWSNTYFLPMAMAFFVAHLIVIRIRYHTPAVELIRQFGIITIIVAVLHYLGGGFTVPFADLAPSIGWADLLSVDLADLFHKVYDRQGYVYRGAAVLLLLLAWPCVVLAERVMRPGSTPEASDYRIQPPAKAIILATSLVAAALFLWSLGPTIRFGKAASIKLPLPYFVALAMSAFRAVGRFSWPLMYLLLGVAALAIDALVARIPAVGNRRRTILAVFCAVLIVSQFSEMHSELRRFKDTAAPEAAQVMPPNSALDAAVSKSTEIEFIPATYDPWQAPWPSLSYYGIKHNVPIYSYHWLARWNSRETVRMQDLTIKRAVECRWTTDRVYAIKRSYLPEIEHCDYEPDVLASYPDWVVLKPKRAGSAANGHWPSASPSH